MGYDVLMDLGGKLLVLVVCYGGLSYATERLVASFAAPPTEAPEAPPAFESARRSA